MGNIEVYHGTGHRALPDFESREDLFGMFYNGDPASSGILTNRKDFATAFAIGAEIAGRGKALVLTFSIPEEVLKLTEPETNGIAYYYTENWVDPTELPRRYLAHIGLTIDTAIQQFAAKEISFYRVSHTYMKTLSFAER